MDKSTERKRKSKGNLSVLDEFTGDAGVIEFQPRISLKEQERIDERTRLADAPKFTEAQPPAKTVTQFNLGQTSDNPKTEPRTNLGQLSDKPRTDVGRHKSSDMETSDNPKTEHRTIPRTNLGQLSDKPRTISAFQALSGLQKSIVILIYDLCRLKGDRVTGPTSIEHFYLKLGSTRLSVQKSIQRLEQKSIVIRKEFRSGRGGWTIYELPENVWSEILQAESSDKLRANLGQLSDNPKTEPKTEPRTSSPCSSSDLNINNTTTTEESIWLNIPEKLKGQLPVNQLRAMLKAGAIDHETLEDSLWGFAHDLEKGLVKSKTNNPTAVFIGALKNGGYISQQYLSQKQAELQELRARVEELKQIRVELESNELTEEFEAFKKDFPEKAESLKPMNTYIKNFEQGGVGYKLWLEEFRKHRVELEII